MATVEEIQVEIRADMSSLRNELRQAGNGIRKMEKDTKKAADTMARSFNYVRVAVTALVVSGLSRLGSGIVGTITKFERFEAALHTVTGSAQTARVEFDRLQKFAATTPFQLEEVVDGFIKLKALGLEPSNEAMRSFGNTALTVGKSLDQFVNAVADASTFEFERLKEFGIIASQQTDSITFLFQNVETKVAKTSQAVQDYLTAIGNNQFAGAMELQFGTLHVAISNMRDEIAKAVVAMGKAGLTGALTYAANGVKTLANEFRVFFETLELYTGRIAIIAGELDKLGSNKYMENFRQFGAYLRAGANDAADAVRDYGGAVSDFLGLSEKFQKLDEDFIARKIGEIPLSGSTDGAEKKTGDGGSNSRATSALERMLGGKPDEILQELNDHFLNAEEVEIAHHQRKIDEIKKFLDMEKNLTAAQREQLQGIETAHRKVMFDKQRKANFDALEEGFSAFRQMLSQAASGNKKMFELQKVASIAEAVLKGRKAIINSYEFGSRFAGPVGGALAAGVAAAATAAQIASIASSSYGGGGSVGGASTGGGGVSAGGISATANTTSSGSTGTPGTTPAARNINIVIQGETFTDKHIRNIIERITEQTGDNVFIRGVPA